MGLYEVWRPLNGLASTPISVMPEEQADDAICITRHVRHAACLPSLLRMDFTRPTPLPPHHFFNKVNMKQQLR